ncbi:3'-5' exonuclease [Citrobacter braakii]|uniref:3'-5' exonuclease n=1 Tax=Citrobacter braakii TaxID=57706 RepID=UPI001904B4CD|nr:3'-5' exonuclease [Citrobacter braakii]MBJ8955886.1 3'-5' exoribonuclease [Citrobacter braakii]
MKHLMIDIEAMDDKSTAAITAIAAIFFNPETGEIGETFSRRISLDDAMSNGGTVSAEAIEWWLRQPSEVRCQLLDDDCQDIELAICDFYAFINENADPASVKLWNGCPSLHSSVLRHALNKFAGQCFTHGNEQSVITMVELASTLGLNMDSIIPYTFTRNAYNHAIHNIKIVSYIWMYLVKIASVK